MRRSPARRRGRVWIAAAALLAGSSHAAIAGADPRARGDVDRTVACFYAPETGGTAYPRFVFERVLAFEARLAAIADGKAGPGDGYDDRDVRDALEEHVAEEILASLADRLIADSPPERRPAPGELQAIEGGLERALVEQMGGRSRVDEAARTEHIDADEIEALVRRRGLAAWYIDRALTPILRPSEEQLRNVFRTSAHPFRGQPYASAHDALERWFVDARVRAAESAFLQAARSRVRIIVSP